MKDSRTLKDLFGAWSVISVSQIFLAEIVVASAWKASAPYSPILNVISDLGAVQCGIHNTREVCSPLAWLMNGSLVLQGVGMILGGLLVGTLLLSVGGHPESVGQGAQPRSAWWIRALLVLSGLGVIAVGLAPEDVIPWVHYLGATVFFVAGSLCLFFLWWVWLHRSWTSWVLLLCALTSSVATIVYTVFSLVLRSPGFWSGFAERLIVYPIVLGFAVMGGTIALGVRRRRALSRHSDRAMTESGS